MYNDKFVADLMSGKFPSLIGFNDTLSHIKKMVDKIPNIPGYPPFNIKKIDDNQFLIEMAVAGFNKSNLELEFHDGFLTVKGTIKTDSENLNKETFYYKGIADRSFVKSFALADTIEITSADLTNGMLKIYLENLIPESKRSKKIPINSEESSKTTSDKTLLTEKNKNVKT